MNAAMQTLKFELGQDGNLVLPLGPWAEEKLFYIGRYCEIFNTAMRAKWGTRVYIDLFAGPGRSLVRSTGEEIDGSPLVALKCRFPFTHYYFNDSDPRAIAALRNRIPPSLSTSVKFFNGDCNQVIDKLLAELATLSLPQTLSFCFIDPFNWEIKFASVVKLTQGKHMDLAITFHTGSMKRFASRASKKLDEFFPTSDWRQGYEARRNKGDRAIGGYLLDCYKQGLWDLGYTDIQERVLLTNRQGVPLYNLLFASKHPLGKDFWDKISQRRPIGQQRLL